MLPGMEKYLAAHMASKGYTAQEIGTTLALNGGRAQSIDAAVPGIAGEAKEDPAAQPVAANMLIIGLVAVALVVTAVILIVKK